MNDSGIFFVGLLGLEPRLFCTKNRRVASYTIDQTFKAENNTVKPYSFEPTKIDIFLLQQNSSLKNNTFHELYSSQWKRTVNEPY